MIKKDGERRVLTIKNRENIEGYTITYASFGYVNVSDGDFPPINYHKIDFIEWFNNLFADKYGYIDDVLKE